MIAFNVRLCGEEIQHQFIGLKNLGERRDLSHRMRERSAFVLRKHQPLLSYMRRLMIYLYGYEVAHLI